MTAGLVWCLTNTVTNLRVLLAVGCVALPRVVHATGATAGRPCTSSRLADDQSGNDNTGRGRQASAIGVFAIIESAIPEPLAALQTSGSSQMVSFPSS